MTDQSPTSATLGYLAAQVPAGSPDAFEAWRWAVSRMFDCDALEREGRSRYSADIISYHFGTMILGAAHISATRFDRPKGVLTRGMDEILVQVYKTGDYHLDANGRATVVRPGDIAVMDLSRPLNIRAHDFSHLCLVISRELAEPMLANIGDAHGLVLRSGSARNTLLRSHMLMLEAQAGKLRLSEAPAITRGTMALIAACIGPSAGARELATPALQSATVQLIRQAIHRSLADPALGPGLLTRQFGLSRASLYRLFEAHGGVMRYIHQRRLAQAFRELSDPAHAHERISTIAYRWGFTNDTVFSRAFRAAYGTTPREARAAAQDALPRNAGAPADAFSTIKQWVSDAAASGVATA